uniref:Uncharacterized protein n=1 Tax=Arion vulgaris TaxID=1028688 RepID=A0A0B7B6Y7_9EUPU
MKNYLINTQNYHRPESAILLNPLVDRRIVFAITFVYNLFSFTNKNNKSCETKISG